MVKTAGKAGSGSRSALRRLFLLCLCALGAGVSRAGEEAAHPYETRRVFIPILLVNPENGFGGGLKYVDKGSSGSAHEFDGHFYYTTRRQGEIEIEHLFRHEAGRGGLVRSEAALFDYPESYFGATNAPEESDEAVYVPVGLRLREEWALSLGRGWRAALSAYGRWVRMESVREVGESSAATLGPQVAGRRGGFNDLWSLSLEYDTRDDERAASDGLHLGQALGRSLLSPGFPYASAETWLAGYRSFRGGWEIAARVFQHTVFGRPPFYEQPYLGDRKLLRGVTRKRLRNRSVQALQAEVRYRFDVPLPDFVNTWQAAIFAGAGRTGDGFVAAGLAEPHFSGGAGGRVVLGRRLAVLRGDLGFSASGLALYVDFGQAF